MLFFHNAQSKIDFPKNCCTLTLKVEFKDKSIIKNLKFTFSDPHPQLKEERLKEFENSCLNQTLNDALKIPCENNFFLSIPHWLLLDAHNQWKSDIPPWQYYKEELICRCFGISKESIQTFAKDHWNASLSTVSQNLKAGAGCSSCHNDIGKILLENRKVPTQNDIESLPNININGETPLEALIKSDNIIQDFLKKRPSIQTELIPQFFKGYILFIQQKGQELAMPLKVELETKIQSIFGKKIITIY